MEVFLLFLLVGVLAQAVDGALGMAYGVVSSSVLLAFGVPPAMASATVHAAEVFTTGASATSHILHKNVVWRLFIPLAAAGVVGGIIGAYFLSGLEGDVVKPYIIGYLALIGLYILYRGFNQPRPRRLARFWMAPMGLIGGFLDATGGGGWGPTVTSTMVGVGVEPRAAIGTVNTAEWCLTVAISASFLFALLTGRWEEAEAIQHHGLAVGGLIAGGLIAAPFAGLITKRVPRRALTFMVGGLLILLSLFQGLQLAGVFG